jgi:hypothetical protein
MNNPRYVRVVRGGVLYYVREDVLKAHNSGADYFVLRRISDFIVEDNKLQKSRMSVLDMVDAHIESHLKSEVITEAQFDSEKIKEHYLEF